jgi:hypothetical protein
MLPGIIEEQRLRAALAFLEAGARADRVDVAPIFLGLRMDRGITVASLVEAWRILQPRRLASPCMLIALWTEVLVVWTGSCW